MTVRRARFRCSVDGTFYYPLDEALDLPPGEVTVSVAKRALRLSTHMGLVIYKRNCSISMTCA